MKILLFAILTICILGGYHEINSAFKHDHIVKEKSIKVHLVPHTHNDVGFWKTVD